MPNRREILIAPERRHLSREIMAGFGAVVLAASGCSVERDEPVPESHTSASPTPEVSESESQLPPSEVTLSETGLDEWAGEVLEVVGCKEGVNVGEYWNGMPHDIAIVSGCKGDAELYNSLEDAQRGGAATLFTKEGGQLWIDGEADDEGEYLTVNDFTITETGAVEREERAFVVAREDLVTVR